MTGTKLTHENARESNKSPCVDTASFFSSYSSPFHPLLLAIPTYLVGPTISNMVCLQRIVLGYAASSPLRQKCHSFTQFDAQSKSLSSSSSRRTIINSVLSTIPLSYLLPLDSAQAATPIPIQSASGTPIRIEELGGGFDIQSPTPSALTSSDVFYPSSMANSKWKVQRVVTSVEGDLSQATVVWKLLGGSDERAFTSKLTEVYDVSYIAAPHTMEDATYEYDGKVLRAAVSDRSYELSSRLGVSPDAVKWDSTSTKNSLMYSRNNNDSVSLTVVQRKIESPSDSGFGSDELYRIQSSSGRMLSLIGTDRAARVRRRYRRGFDEATGKRIIDCIEIVSTFRVLDGVAGIELPTSTCKSRLRLTEL